MKIFVTGGTGFVGSHFLQCAIAEGHSITALCRPGSSPKLKLVLEPRWLFKPLDQLSAKDVEGFDAIVHFASVGVSPQKATWDELIRWNFFASLNLIKQAKLAGIKRVIYAGTFAEYGLSALKYEVIPPSASLLPIDSYAGSKAATFAAAFAFAVENSLEFCYLRIFSAYGEGQHEKNFWPSLQRAAYAGDDFDMTLGEQIRDYVPVEYVAKAFLDACTRSDVESGKPLILNIGTGKPISLREFANEWWINQWKASGILKFGAIPYRNNEIMRFVPEVESKSKLN